MNKEKLMKEICYEKSQIVYCYMKLNQIISRLDELMMKIEDGEFDND
ncbi:hypothetical protein [Spiroplasma endosymbiont of Aleiodes alternator]